MKLCTFLYRTFEFCIGFWTNTLYYKNILKRMEPANQCQGLKQEERTKPPEKPHKILIAASLNVSELEKFLKINKIEQIPSPNK